MMKLHQHASPCVRKPVRVVTSHGACSIAALCPTFSHSCASLVGNVAAAMRETPCKITALVSAYTICRNIFLSLIMHADQALGNKHMSCMVQEKMSFMIVFGKVPVYDAGIRLPAVLGLLLVAIALLVGAQLLPGHPQGSDGDAVQYEAVVEPVDPLDEPAERLL